MVHSASKSSMIDAIQRAKEDTVRGIAASYAKDAHAKMHGDDEFMAMDINMDGVIDRGEWDAYHLHATEQVPNTTS